MSHWLWWRPEVYPDAARGRGVRSARSLSAQLLRAQVSPERIASTLRKLDWISGVSLPLTLADVRQSV